jgi:hypothetical protein
MSGYEEKTSCVILECAIEWDSYSSCVKIRCQQTASADYNRPSLRVCYTDVKCSQESWVYKWSINGVINPNPVSSHSHVTIFSLWQAPLPNAQATVSRKYFCAVTYVNFTNRCLPPLVPLTRPHRLPCDQGKKGRSDSIFVDSNYTEYENSSKYQHNTVTVFARRRGRASW